MKVKITQKHIDEGKRHHPCKCPIALALDELLVPPGGPTRYIYVGDESAWVGRDEKTCHRFRLPLEARQFIRAFDERGSKIVSPCEMDLPIPEEYNLHGKSVI